MKIKEFFRKKGTLWIGLTDRMLSLCMPDPENPGAGALKEIPLEETGGQALAGETGRFLRDARFDQTCLVLPRSGVIQKELHWAPSLGLKEGIETSLRQDLPSHQEMSCGIALGRAENGARALVYAVPIKKIEESLKFLSALGLKPDEIVAEDQALFWSLREKTGPEPVLAVERALSGFLFCVLNENGILLSFSCPDGDEEFNETVSDLSFSLLEKGIKPVKIMLSRHLSGDKRGMLLETFQLPHETAEKRNILGGTAELPESVPASLLTPELKKARHLKIKARNWKRLAAAFSFFLAAGILSACFHLVFLESKQNRIKAEAGRLSNESGEIIQISKKLGKVREAQASKEKTLELLKSLASGLPAGIRFQEIQTDDSGLVLRAESPNHGLSTETVQILEKNTLLSTVRLEHTRLRKRLNQDLIEFEVSAKWK